MPDMIKRLLIAISRPHDPACHLPYWLGIVYVLDDPRYLAYIKYPIYGYDPCWDRRRWHYDSLRWYFTDPVEAV